MRTTNVNMPRPAETQGGLRGAKRKRTAAPEETCPYCSHVYTVRDGLSTKTDLDGNRYTAATQGFVYALQVQDILAKVHTKV